METQVGRKPPLQLLSLQYFIIEKTSYNICAVADSYQHAGTLLHSFTSLSWKVATTPCSRLPASPGRELQPPNWRLQPSAPLWTIFHQFSYLIQQLQYSTTCRPRFIIFSDWTHSILLSIVNHETDTYNSLTDISKPAEQIRNFLPQTSANPSLHTRFPFSDVAYIRASVHIKPRIPQYKL